MNLFREKYRYKCRREHLKRIKLSIDNIGLVVETFAAYRKVTVFMNINVYLSQTIATKVPIMTVWPITLFFSLINYKIKKLFVVT